VPGGPITVYCSLLGDSIPLQDQTHTGLGRGRETLPLFVLWGLPHFVAVSFFTSSASFSRNDSLMSSSRVRPLPQAESACVPASVKNGSIIAISVIKRDSGIVVGISWPAKTTDMVSDWVVGLPGNVIAETLCAQTIVVLLRDHKATLRYEANSTAARGDQQTRGGRAGFADRSKSGSMFTLEYFTVTRSEDEPFSLQIPSHLLAALRRCGWWIPTCRLDLQGASEGSKDQRRRFEKYRCRTPLLLILSERDQVPRSSTRS
jgi:hypothetical protein